MKSFVECLDRLARRLCMWLEDFFPGGHILAIAGNSLAGLETALPLPVDRRLFPNQLYMHSNAVERANAASVRSGTVFENRCDFWGYCHMNGQPCVWCGGSNSVGGSGPGSLALDQMGKTLCPRGKKPGSAWYGCCQEPGGAAKFIAFLDCCGTGYCVRPWRRCTNWPAAKNWCFFQGEGVTFGENSYYCTVAINLGNDAGCA